ncbi:MAG: HPP family protein [Simkaniaceae bacterium]
MFYIRNNPDMRQPYRVEDIQKDRQAKEDQSSHQQFDHEDEARHHEKFLKASEKLYKQKSVVLASEIMSKQLVTLRENLSVEEAWEQIKNHEIHYFPIVNAEGKLLGILSEREILRGIQQKSKKTLREMTASRTLCAEPETLLAEVMQVFAEQNLEVLPVVDEKQKVIGILTQNDLLQTMLKISKLEEKKFFRS